MKRVFALSLLVALSPVAFSQSGDMKGMDMKMEKKDSQATVHKATGVVTKIDKDKVSIKHEPVPSLNWPAMTMAFKVKDKSLMQKLKKDEKVSLEFVQEGRDYVVTAVK
jgi:Cu/Ag efflux protein CusF